MKNLILAVVLLLIPLTLTSGVPSAPDIHGIDFKNYSFPWVRAESHSSAYPSLYRWIIPLPQKHIHVVNGLHRFYDPGMNSAERILAPLVSVDSATYGDLDGDGVDEAAVHLNYSTGGTMNWDFLYIYKLKSGQPELLANLKSGSRADGGLARSAIQNGQLVLDFADPDRRAGDCCSEGYVRVHFRWHGSTFVEEGPREHGDLDLRHHR